MSRTRHLQAVVTTAAVVLGLGSSGVAWASQGVGWAKRIAAAERFADGRAGTVSFAVVDESGRLRGDGTDRVHSSASVVKVMLLIAFLREPDVRDDELTAGERRLLGPMIRRSDNGSATAVFTRVGADALHDLAREADLDRFTTQPTWGLSTITAGSQAQFFFRLERFIPQRHRGYVLRLLTRIVPRQRWGIPPAAPAGWTLHFKGGWSGRPKWRINQVMLLRKPGRRFAVAILTSDQPGKRYGIQTVRGVARRLLRDYNRVTD
jgi:Beta-lactamase enzyme family